MSLLSPNPRLAMRAHDNRIAMERGDGGAALGAFLGRCAAADKAANLAAGWQEAEAFLAWCAGHFLEASQGFMKEVGRRSDEEEPAREEAARAALEEYLRA